MIVARVCGRLRLVGWLVLAGLGASSGAGCSWLLMTPAYSGPTKEPNYACTDSAGPAGADIVLGTLELIGGAVAVSSSNPQQRSAGNIGFIFGGAFIGSAIHGFIASSECAELKGTAPVRQSEPAPRSVLPRAAVRGQVPPPAGESPRAPRALPPPFEGRAVSPDGGATAATDGGAALAPVRAAPVVPQKSDDE